MANIKNLTKYEEKIWNQWLLENGAVRDIAEKYPPWKLYLLKTTGQRVFIESYSEDDTVKVNVSGKYNITIFERSVFGVNVTDLEECDLPRITELVGTILIEQNDIDKYIEGMKNGTLDKEKFDAIVRKWKLEQVRKN